MRTFTKVSPALWRSNRFRGLSSSDAKLVHCYFLTCEHQNSAGCFRLPDEYAAHDLGWDVGRYRKARDEVEAAALIRCDANTKEVFVEGWFRFNPPMNDKHGLGIRRALEAIESDGLREHVLAAYRDQDDEQHAKSMASDKMVGALDSHLTATAYLNGGRR